MTCRDCKFWTLKTAPAGTCSKMNHETTSWTRCSMFRKRTRDDERYRIVKQDGFVFAVKC